ncbi:hypothetical protein PSN45_000001 [Yamadazyma tenuis]|uniref:uncharacterized protein n=1 Tax=Candida tenuis TaxID=2315449 RepID=UPI00279F694F|nr:hypothetical protein PSN45_000001 [Yamadazyma tenuis]
MILKSITFLSFVTPLVLGITGCSPSSTESGLVVDYFDDVETLNLSSAYLSTIDAMTPDYTAYGVSDITFYMTKISDGEYRDVYGRSTPVDEFGLRLSGYFRAPETGTYTFQFTLADNQASLAIGGVTDTLNCCSSSSNLQVNGSIYASEGSKGVDTTVTKVRLVGGDYYPVKIIYYQAGIDTASLRLTVTYPDGNNHTTDLPWYYTNETESELCTTTTTTNIWTGTDTEYFTVTGSDGDVTVTKEIPESTTTTTDVWTGSVPTTITIYPSNLSDPVTITVLTPETTTTTTEPWTGTETTITTIYPSNPSDPVTVDIKTPESTTTTTEVWTGTEPSTTTIYPSNPSDPITFVILSPETTTTTTEPWTGTGITTTTIYPSNPSDPVTVDIKTPESRTTTTSYGTVVVETPEPVVIEKDVTTIILPCTCKEPSTTTTTGDDGKKTVVCNIPYSLVSSVVVTEPCTNAAGDTTVIIYTTFTVAAAVTANPTETVAPTGAKGNGSGAAAEVASAGNGSESSPQEVSTYEAMGSKNTYTFLAVLSALLWISF